ncbi:hypothetical protein GQ600_8031 [Phytophthora cactorum]|nr:hypothetical protein GQ600_8031 [Phytophthora cactorum]
MFELLAIALKSTLLLSTSVRQQNEECEVLISYTKGGVEALSRVELAHKYLAASAKHNPKAVARHQGTLSRRCGPSRVGVPLTAQHETQNFTSRYLLPNFVWSPTDKFLDEISRSFLA